MKELAQAMAEKDLTEVTDALGISVIRFLPRIPLTHC